MALYQEYFKSEWPHTDSGMISQSTSLLSPEKTHAGHVLWPQRMHVLLYLPEHKERQAPPTAHFGDGMNSRSTCSESMKQREERGSRGDKLVLL